MIFQFVFILSTPSAKSLPPYSDLAESRRQISDVKGLDMEYALKRMGEQHGFI